MNQNLNSKTMKQYDNIHNKLANWWRHGNQSSPLLFMTALKQEHPPIADTEDLQKYWTDVDFIIERDMQMIDEVGTDGLLIEVRDISNRQAEELVEKTF